MFRTAAAVCLIISAPGAIGLAGPPPAEGRLFWEDFRSDPAPRWLAFSIPGPQISLAWGRPPPALDLYSGRSGRAGLMSKRLFPVRPGLLLQADIWVGRSERGCGGSLGFPLQAETFREGKWPEWLVGLSYDYLGRSLRGSSRVPEGGTLTCTLVDEDGRLEIRRRPYWDRWINGWHTFAIYLLPDGFVEFRVDGELIYASRRQLARGLLLRPLLLGHRSSGRRLVGHDNVEVRTLLKEG